MDPVEIWAYFKARPTPSPIISALFVANFEKFSKTSGANCWSNRPLVHVEYQGHTQLTHTHIYTYN